MSNEMRKLIEAIGSNLLSEDYYDRVEAVVSQIEANGPIEANVLKHTITDIASQINASELAFGVDSRQFKEFVADVTKALKAKNLIKRKESTKAPYQVIGVDFSTKVPVTHQEIQELGQKMQTFAGESFPDGDPIDLLMPWFQQKGWDAGSAFDKLVPVAAKKYLGTKDYNEYLANMWDDVYADASHDAQHGDDHMYKALGGDGAQNPWK